jgi:TRAP-type C4-dicarboxylate transport system permease small subunit
VFDVLNKAVGFLAQAMAILGGIVLIVLIAVTCASIIGRSLTFIGLNQIKGDYELVELGVGFAIFAFLPWAQYSKGHARVDLFEKTMARWQNLLSDLLSDILLLAIALIGGHRLWLGMLDKQSYGETTFILQFPIWQAYAAGVLGMVVFAIVAVFCLVRSLRSFGGAT